MCRVLTLRNLHVITTRMSTQLVMADTGSALTCLSIPMAELYVALRFMYICRIIQTHSVTCLEAKYIIVDGKGGKRVGDNKNAATKRQLTKGQLNKNQQ